jgi:hypothetical protein
VTLGAAVDFRNLNIQAELEADLGLACPDKPTYFCDFTEAEYNVQKVCLSVLN